LSHTVKLVNIIRHICWKQTISIAYPIKILHIFDKLFIDSDKKPA